MSLAPITTSASSPASSAASTSPVPPPTPLTPTSAANGNYSLPNSSTEQLPSFEGLGLEANGIGNGSAPGAAGPVRRKPSRRANTAERRATHNAVERQRRETLNGRFLDLAALLPNLTSVRRPSKSAIVNSSIALIHTQRRGRSNAARELRLLKLEADQLRAEVNEWRDRAGIARAEEPVRTREFEDLLALEESDEDLEQAERRAMDIAKESLRLDAMGAGADGPIMGGGNPFAYSMSQGGMGMYGGLDEDDEDGSSDGQAARTRPGSQGSVGSVPSLPIPIAIPRQNAMASNPMIFDPSNAMLQTHPTHQGGISPYANFDLGAAQSLGLAGMAPTHDKLVAWNAQLYSSLAQNQWAVQQAAQPMYTPPASASVMGGFMRYEDGTDSSSVGSGSVPDMSQFHHHAAALAARNRPNPISVSPPKGSVTPPASAPSTTTTYSDTAIVSNSEDPFAAAYGFNVNANTWKNGASAGITSGTGGGSGGLHYGATMGMFM